jgi:hypothetical protein
LRTGFNTSLIAIWYKVLEATGGVTAAAGKLLPLAQKAWEWGRMLFP